MLTDEIIKDKLNRKESRELLYLIRKYNFNFYSTLIYDSLESCFIEIEKNLKEYENLTHIPNHVTNRLSSIIRIKELYLKVSDDLSGCIIHWEETHKKQKEIKDSYKENGKPERKDNKTYKNYGNRSYHPNKIRYPKKNRKTAWKRFYKLFPNLNPDE